jgi:GTP-binding protein
MKIKDVELKTVCGYTSALPETGEIQVAFAGKSNVGKSSLINAVMNRRRLARVGETPGKTRTINFYYVNALCREKVAESGQGAFAQAEQGAAAGTETGDQAAERKVPAETGDQAAERKMPAETEKQFYLVDLPGYGYANVPEAEKAKWGQMIERYLQKSDMLKMVFLLVDIRHEPGANDRQMYDWIVFNGYQPVIIATKADKIRRSQLQKQIRLIRSGLGAAAGTVVLPFSALTKSGVEEIRSQIEAVL